MLLSPTPQQRVVFTEPHHFTQIEDTDDWCCNVCTPASNDHIGSMSMQAAICHERSSNHAHNVVQVAMWWNPQPTDAAAWDVPIQEDAPLTVEEMKMRASQIHVDHVRDMVPFWIRGVEAAEKGEVLRLEQFLETLEETSDSWLNTEDPWQYSNPGLHQTWGAQDDKAGLRKEHSDSDNGWGRVGDATGWTQVRSNSSVGSGSAIKAEPRPKRMTHPTKRGVKRQSYKRTRAPRDHYVGSVNEDAYAFVEDVAKQQEADADRKRRMHMFFQMPTHEKVQKIDEVIRHLRCGSAR